MSADLEMGVLSPASDGRGYVAGFAVTDEMIVALGGLGRAPVVMASSNARDFVERRAPKDHGLRGALAVADALWACGEHGQLATSRDHGGSWKLIETGTEGCLFGLALAADGALWVVGDQGYAARVLGPRVRRVDFDTATRLTAVRAVRDEIVALGFDGQVRRWRAGEVVAVPCGATKPLTGLAITMQGTWVVVGDGGFIARSPDGLRYARVDAGVEVDLEAVCALPDGSLVAVGGRGTILRSIDDALTWSEVPHQLGRHHLWSIGRFGQGVLIGGDGGLVARLAPPDDATWRERVESFDVSPLEDVLSMGAEGFLENGLDVYLAEIAASGAADADDAAAAAAAAAQEGASGGEAGDAEASALLGAPGDAASFRASYGMPLPPEAEAFFEKVAGCPPRGSFRELLLDARLLPDVGEHNLFELLVRRNQQVSGRTDLAGAFCGAFHVGSLSNGDTYHLELYEWEGPRQVLHFDRETHSISKFVADSLESLVYLAALTKAGTERKISEDIYEAGLHELHGKVSPTWHFDIDNEGFEHFEPTRRDAEFFFYRSRWITALLKHDGVTRMSELRDLFMADFNQVISPEQLPARIEACERFIPTALYSMWRAYFFDEPELGRYLEVGRRHAARLVRDAARLIDELSAGRNELGTIRDVRAYLHELRALGLDPRRAAQRKAEADARAMAEAAHQAHVVAALDKTPAERWPELAWRWLGDGAAHRVLLERLERTPPRATELAALGALDSLGDDERATALPRLAAELSPELEAVLVGSLVRNDPLAGFFGGPGEDDEDDDEDDEDDEDDGDDDEDDEDDDGDAGERAPGWDAIDAALAPIYGDVEPLHYGTVIPYALGGNDPLHGISVYRRETPVPHWHFVTYGFTDLFDKETDDPEVSGFGFELTLRLARDPAGVGDEPPSWALNFLQNLGRYVFGTGNRFALGHKMGLNGPIALEHDTQITAVCFAEDPELGEFTSEHGAARFLQVVGITDDEYALVQEWSTAGLLEVLARRLPSLVTDLGRAPVLADPEIAAEIERRVAQEGSSEQMASAGELRLQIDDGTLTIELGALYAAALPRAIRGRIRHGRSYELSGRDAALRLEPAERAGYRRDEEGVVLELTQELARELEAQLRPGLAGTYRFGTWLQIVVVPSLIRNQAGQAIDVRGVADPEEVRRLVAAENARLAVEAAAEDAAAVADDDADDDADDGADDGAPRGPLAAALGMSRRALGLSPADAQVQLTHATLLLDADFDGLPGAAAELLELLPRFAPHVRVQVAVYLGRRAHARFSEAVDIALGEALPAQIFAATSTTMGDGAVMMSFGDIADEVFGQLGAEILDHVPAKMARLVPLLPDGVSLLAELAKKSLAAEQRDSALALYDRLLALPIPDDGEDRMDYLRAMNNACVQAHAARAYDAAVRIADRVQPVAHENPHLYHAAACAYAAAGELERAFEQVKLAVRHGYEHLSKMEVDGDLGPLLERPEFKALFRDWHARQEGN
ncbi:MAG TPA: suppressor of fused domain protein [Kofleriaceae bacterium]|nr:suppressor of fused domain protein [Kofleriaceae bacterium]